MAHNPPVEKNAPTALPGEIIPAEVFLLRKVVLGWAERYGLREADAKPCNY